MKKHNREIIYLAGFLFFMPVALTSYVNSSFLETYVNDFYVSIIYVIASLITVLGFMKIPQMLTRFGNRKTNLMFLFLILVSFLLLGNIDSIFIAIGAFILFFVTSNLAITTFDIFLENFSGRRKIGRFRGFYMTVTSSAYVIAQFISGSIIAKSSFRGIYLVAALFILLVFILFAISLHNFIDPKYKRTPMSRTLELFWRKKDMKNIFSIYLILRFFYAWMVIYMPIYLNQYIGFSWSEIGVIFSIMLLPFVILDFPLGKLSDKIGEKKMLAIGFLVIAISTFIIPFLQHPKLWLWALVLFSTRVGAATIETMTESYFFKSITEKNVNMISFFRDTMPISYVIAPLVAIPVLFLVPSFEYLFFVLSAILLVGLFINLRLKDIK